MDGPNVMGNRYIGGNYWGTPDRTGFSDVTPDTDGDGFADGSFVLPGRIGTDHHPLSPSLAPSQGGVTALPAVTIDTTALQSENIEAAGDSGDVGRVAPSASPSVGGSPGNVTTEEVTATTALTTAPATAGNTAAQVPPTPTPGFGATVALVGLGAVALLVLRRE